MLPSIKTLLLGVTFVACALGQTKIAFTSVPAIAAAGKSYNITWGGGDGSPVTITLREGDPDDLRTVTTLADGVTADFFVWAVSNSFVTASDYALQITQGQDDINYSGLFSITGGTGVSSNSSSSTTKTATVGNSTASITVVGTAASLGTGTALPRNTTFSSATILRTTSQTPAVTLHQSSSTIEASSTQAAPTAAATTSAPSGGAGQLGSSAALVMGVFAAILCLS